MVWGKILQDSRDAFLSKRKTHLAEQNTRPLQNLGRDFAAMPSLGRRACMPCTLGGMWGASPPRQPPSPSWKCCALGLLVFLLGRMGAASPRKSEKPVAEAQVLLF